MIILTQNYYDFGNEKTAQGASHPAQYGRNADAFLFLFFIAQYS